MHEAFSPPNPSTFLVGRDGRPVALAIGPRAWGSAEARALIQALQQNRW